MTLVRVAAFQRFRRDDDVAAMAESISSDLAWADDRGVDLALFPECHPQGHAYDRATLERRALSIDDPLVVGMLRRLETIRTTAILGIVERRGAPLFNSALVIARGEVKGRFAKVHPNEEGIDAGTAFPVFDTFGWPFGINICNDTNYPEAAEEVARGGARLIAYPLNNVLRPAVASEWRVRSVENLQARAVQTGCWVMSADVTGHYVERLSYGCTAVISPTGEVVAKVDELEEGVAIFDIEHG